MKRVICIAGPTASGKSKWAVSLAKAVNGEIINADALQVYKDLQILSARPDDDEMKGIAHHLFGFVDGSARYSTGQWLRAVQPIILDCLARQKTPILVGGTGLYFKALTSGLAAIPVPRAQAVQAAQALLDDSIEALRDEAERLDPIATQKVLGADPQRLLRIVGVARGTRQPLSAWQSETKPVIPKAFWRGAVLFPERQTLYDAINARYDQMVEQGGLDEARRLLGRNLDRTLPLMKAVGLPPLLSYLEGDISYEDAVSLAKRDTRRFAKRQFTWFRGQCKDWEKIESCDDKSRFRQNILQINS